jgi:hypothetical protein
MRIKYYQPHEIGKMEKKKKNKNSKTNLELNKMTTEYRIWCESCDMWVSEYSINSSGIICDNCGMLLIKVIHNEKS